MLRVDADLIEPRHPDRCIRLGMLRCVFEAMKSFLTSQDVEPGWYERVERRARNSGGTSANRSWNIVPSRCSAGMGGTCAASSGNAASQESPGSKCESTSMTGIVPTS